MNIFTFLKEKNIPFERFDHPAVFTCEEANRLRPDLPGFKTKNLFLRDRKGGRHFLILVSEEKRVDLKALSDVLQSTKVSFGSPERLKKHLKIEPGSVSLLSLINDPERHVEVFVDESIWGEGALQAHPLINTATLVIPFEGVERFVRATGHQVRVIEMPEKSAE